jgi:hypothetical protein
MLFVVVGIFGLISIHFPLLDDVSRSIARFSRPDIGCLGIGDRHGYMLAP